MTIRYPNGQPYLVNDDKKTKKNQPKKKKTGYSNRGMTLEEDLNQTNDYYLLRKIAVIHKKPIPIQVVNVDYPSRSAAKITEAYYKKASTTDYNGIYNGYYIDFEAKETRNKTSFPLKNFHDHQLSHMEACVDQGGICFIVVRFSTLDKVFILDFSVLKKWWDQQFEKNGKKSIPYSVFEKDGYELQYSLAPRLPYLSIVDKLIVNRDL
ncbi:Holliday junction resolvase RecU [Alkalibacterium pelagium]|uniref:Holliday junction resolvase RecU n=1 Tax=Alkalibacterium pelagium TaxID=426702 RepID=A0A1H7G5K8_9LACT|nr:Holliday junction resolvase RecU [Alkalibacterium pelagium]GEN49944.1 Holliday junction resolvase RecU [Alkalibacterium pelagium]SEK31740.1 recombination protein U [Alkalibacterium pelagium]